MCVVPSDTTLNDVCAVILVGTPYLSSTYMHLIFRAQTVIRTRTLPPPPSTPPCRGFRSKGLPSNRAYFLTTMLSISPMASDPRRTTLSTPDTYYIHRRQTCFSFVHATQADVQVNLLHRPNAPSRIHRPLPAPTWGPSMFTTIFFPARKFSPPTGAKQVVYR